MSILFQKKSFDETMLASGYNRRLLLAICLGVYGSLYSMLFLPAAYFPASSIAKSIGAPSVGLIFAAYPLATAAATPLPMVVMSALGLRGCVLLGLGLATIASLLFGLISQLAAASLLPHGHLLVAMLACSRAVGGAGAALAEAGCLAAVSSRWSDNIGSALAAIEIVTGAAAGVGAALGASLFAVGAQTAAFGAFFGSYLFPSLISALLPASMLVSGLLLMPPHLRETDRAHRLCLHAPRWTAGRYATCLSIFLSAVVCEALLPLYAPHLVEAPFDYSVPQAGVFVSAVCAAYTLVAMALGPMIDAISADAYAPSRLKRLMAIGWVCSCFAHALVGPIGSSELLPGAIRRMCTLAAPALIGSSTAVLILPSLADLQSCVHPADEEGRAATCAVWNGIYSFGSALGPVLSTLVEHRLGFASVCTALVALGAFMATMLNAARQWR